MLATFLYTCHMFVARLFNYLYYIVFVVLTYYLDLCFILS